MPFVWKLIGIHSEQNWNIVSKAAFNMHYPRQVVDESNQTMAIIVSIT